MWPGVVVFDSARLGVLDQLQAISGSVGDFTRLSSPQADHPLTGLPE